MKKTKGQWMALLAGVAVASSAFADGNSGIDVHAVQSKLTRAHASWHAKESWVTRLSGDELRRMMGVQKAPQGRLDFESRVHSMGAASSIDWRNMNGINWLGPVMNQGNCGSCVAFATIATLEGRTSIAAGLPWLHPSFSPQALFACGGGGCESGWMPDGAAEYLQSSGVPDESCMPYTMGSTGVDASCNSMCSDAASRTVKIAGYSTPTSWGGSVDAVKAALKNGPLVTTLTVYSDFVTYGGGVYKHITGDALGGHAVSIVGYDDTQRALLIRNSWGKEWGENGFAWISYDDVSGVGSETWAFDIAPATGYVSVATPADKEYVSGQYQLHAQTQGLHDTVQFHVVNQAREVRTLDCRRESDRDCSSVLDTTQMKEGRYEIFADAGTSGIKSQVREFYVINSEPKMSISFTPADGVDLTQPQNGRPEFDIKVSSAPVPMQHVEFRAIDSSGKIASVKTNDYVLDLMKMGWRTMTVADGQYTILFHGETVYNGKTYAVDSNSFTITVKN